MKFHDKSFLLVARHQASIHIVYFGPRYCRWILFFVVRLEIHGETPDRLKRLVVVQIPEVTVYHVNAEHVCLAVFCWRCDEVEMRETCLEAQKSIQ